MEITRLVIGGHKKSTTAEFAVTLALVVAKGFTSLPGKLLTDYKKVENMTLSVFWLQDRPKLNHWLPENSFLLE